MHVCAKCGSTYGTGEVVEEYFLCNPCLKKLLGEAQPMASWRLCWRNGFAPVISSNGLLALARALRDDDPRLHQGATTMPPPLMMMQDWPCEGADAIAYCGWQGEGKKTVGEVEEYFATKCFEADEKMGEPDACRWFLNWLDDTPRNEMRRQLLFEVERELGNRSLPDRGDPAGLIPPEFWDAFILNPGDTTILGVIADFHRENGNEHKADALKAQIEYLTEFPTSVL